jgi:hypothetical protein
MRCVGELKPSVRCLRFLALFLFLGPLLPFRAAAAKEEIRIVTISPATNKPLRVRDTCDFEIKIEYQVPDSSPKLRRIWVIIWRGRGETAQSLASWTQVVGHGKGLLTFSSAVRIPDTGDIVVRASIAGLPKPGREQERVPLLAADNREFAVVDASGKRTKSAVAKDVMKIVSITPVPGTSLRIGEMARFDIKANYDLRSAETGRVVWIWATGGDMQAVLATESVRKGKGTLAFNRSMQVRPGTASDPFIFALLMPEGSARGTVGDSKGFHLDQPQQAQATVIPQIAVDVAGEPEDRVIITSISPPPGTIFHGGETVDFEVQVTYEIASLDALYASVRFGIGSAYAMDTRIIRKGKGRFTVNPRLLIPKDSGTAFPINVRFSAPANATDIRTYPIAAP